MNNEAEKNYEESRRVFYKLVDEINAIYKTLPDNLSLKTNISGVEFFPQRLTLINTHSANPVSAILKVCGVQGDGQNVYCLQLLSALNLPLIPSRSPRSKSFLRGILRDEVS